MPLKTLLPKLANLFPLLIFSGGSYYVYRNHWPTTIGEWQSRLGRVGSRIKNNDDHFRAMFDENREHVDELGVEGLTPSSSLDEGNLTKLKNWCNKSWKKPWDDDLVRKIKKFCTYDPQTVKGLIMGEGKYVNFIEEDNDYKTVFAVYKHLPGLLSKIPETVSSTPNEEGKTKVKQWCEGQLGKKIKESKLLSEKFESIFAWCTKAGYTTVEQKIKKGDEGWTIITEDGEWKKAFGKWKSTSQVLEAIKKANGSETSLSAQTSNDVGWTKMKKWCDDGIKKNIYEEGVYMDEYKLIKSACRKTN